MTAYHFVSDAASFGGLIIPVFEDIAFDSIVSELDELYGGIFSSVMKSKDFEGKKMQTSLLYTQDADVPRVLLIGLGKSKDFNITIWKKAVGAATLSFQNKKVQTIGILAPSFALKEFGAATLGKEMTVAMELAAYAFDEYRQEKARVKPLKSVWILGMKDKRQEQEFKKGVAKGQAIAEAANLTRRLGNIPPRVMTPSLLASEAKKLAKKYEKLTVRVLSRTEIKKLGMGCFLGVSAGSIEEPKFIILEYMGARSEKTPPTVLVGKGITFDSGGLSLKPEAYMRDMKFDMLGAATVLGVVKAAASLQLKKNIVGLLPACENMPGKEAYRPDDILTAMNGKTVLVENTDAEGRLILADALCYAARYNPKEVIDFATLTGACMVAIGTERSGLFSQNEKIVEKLQASSETVGEQLWRLPLGEEYSEAMKCEVADIKNIGGSRYGGASTAAAFLEFFTHDAKSGKPNYPWAHIDLSSCYLGSKGKPFMRGGATGFGVETMVEYLS
jgi:leucyl aminopeptidase